MKFTTRSFTQNLILDSFQDLHLVKIQGFTLIELLVVILIIGILAAVAVPKYRHAMDKARVLKYRPILEAIIKAQELYFLEHGEYAVKIIDLGLDVTSKNCVPSKGSFAGYLLCNEGILFQQGVVSTAEGLKSRGYLQFFYCPTLGASDPGCGYMFSYTYYYPHTSYYPDKAGKGYCSAGNRDPERYRSLIPLFCN